MHFPCEKYLFALLWCIGTLVAVIEVDSVQNKIHIISRRQTDE